jgi:adenosylcobinamide-GDP ribazoletransferase
MRPWQAAVGMFTVIPLGISPDEKSMQKAIAWLPAVGAALAVPATAVLLAVQVGGDTVPRRLLGAVLAVAVLDLLTGGLHLDGLADTVDGLATQRPRAETLDIMRRGDAGPLGVAALVMAVLLQVSSVAALPPGWYGAGAVGLATVIARIAVVLAAGPRFLPARPNGFGALVAGQASARARIGWVSGAAVAVTAAGELTAGWPLAADLLAAAAAGLLAAEMLCRAARRRLGGLTGDIFGAVVEITTATTLVVLAVLL